MWARLILHVIFQPCNCLCVQELLSIGCLFYILRLYQTSLVLLYIGEYHLWAWIIWVPSFQFTFFFISICCLMPLVEDSRTILDSNDKRGCPCPVSDLNGNIFNFSYFRNDDSCHVFSSIALMVLKHVPSTVICLTFCFIRKARFILSTVLCVYIKIIIWFLFFISFNVVDHIHCFAYVQPSLHTKNNLTWCRPMIFKMWCWIQLASISNICLNPIFLLCPFWLLELGCFWPQRRSLGEFHAFQFFSIWEEMQLLL